MKNLHDAMVIASTSRANGGGDLITSHAAAGINQDDGRLIVQLSRTVQLPGAVSDEALQLTQINVGDSHLTEPVKRFGRRERSLLQEGD